MLWKYEIEIIFNIIILNNDTNNNDATIIASNDADSLIIYDK